jgi:LPS-assembly protein
MQVFCNFLLALSIFCTVQNSYALDSPVKENDLITLKADLIKYDDNSDTLAANGNVFVVMGSYILRADSLYYDIKKDVLFAEGNIRIKDEQGRIATGALE